MNSATVFLEDPRARASERAGHELLSYWITRCDQFLDRQRQTILERDASANEIAEHVAALKFMIRVTLALQALLADPDAAAQRFAPALSGKLLQLQESLKLLQNPMTEQQADAVLQSAFPDGR
ncbi:MAG: hypothetical protein C5B50_18665 [Verrucomicrobia bacterium]|nr:MAG: hypothetical protein C5B50_18665 [Verrucomicrobiota bacterium]